MQRAIEKPKIKLRVMQNDKVICDVKPLNENEIKFILNALLYYYQKLNPEADILKLKEALSKKNIVLFAGERSGTFPY